ncbi:hypothetical protein EIN_180030 [Entamoeba invadens IP1]|uniref:Isopentenyl phosphate kinase n=1 Tax=Entamoeba invadens TaxID=33085 RepID=S0AZQ1_ENTIV|nr:hypothetical protein EIN_180030 [Entamoeba invadens IP1]ELP93946.1 hypothetical protein EIN_180030 [Entamoeba invadens IP1]BAN40294.1 hypothetical protein, conserved [Entamoeba invadens]BAN40322.1 hypothetical protein, conserved [Entamoeba invadens]BAN40758.1 hypothetical protein, conserved [Entamoeba invadens]|eukprot:XP_004260717.1 hypothetical protein EIN_180030 [Entamoeba invadens IP1]
MDTPLFIIKIGGGFLTEKVGENGAVYLDKIHLFCKVLSSYKQSHPTHRFILVHGAGSFGHVPAAEYSLMERFHPKGVLLCEMAMQKLNEIVINSLEQESLHVFPFHPVDFIVTTKRRISECYLRPLELMLSQGIIPVLHGDVVTDTEQGSCILSADQIVPFLSKKFKTHRVGFISQSPVYDNKKEVIPLINLSNYNTIKKYLGASDGVDVTGGMAGKIKELIEAAEDNDTISFVFSGDEKSLTKFLDGEDVGTKVCK